jgi:adenylate cyclase
MTDDSATQVPGEAGNRERLWQEAGLYDPRAVDARERLELLAHLEAGGASISEMSRAQREGWLELVLSDRILLQGGAMVSISEIVETSGVSLEQVLRIRLASGFASDPAEAVPLWVADDVAGFELGTALFGTEPLLAFTRVMGAAAERIAEAAIALFVAEVRPTLAPERTRPLETAIANERANSLISVVDATLSHFVREHLRMAVTRQREAGQGGSTTISMAIGFVDLVGSTKWAARLALGEASRALARFESAAWEAATRRGGRVVKLIGDEAMIAAPSAEVVVRIALDVAEACERDAVLPPCRGAVGFGDVVFRDGDYFGSLVNLMSRAVKAAEPSRIVVTAEARADCERSGAGFLYQAAEEHPLRDIVPAVHLFTVGQAGT